MEYTFCRATQLGPKVLRFKNYQDCWLCAMEYARSFGRVIVVSREDFRA